MQIRKYWRSGNFWLVDKIGMPPSSIAWNTSRPSFFSFPSRIILFPTGLKNHPASKIEQVNPAATITATIYTWYLDSVWQIALLCLLYLSINKYQKYKSVELGDQLDSVWHLLTLNLFWIHVLFLIKYIYLIKSSNIMRSIRKSSTRYH